mmetsp:Transcript_27198/g.108898  ORF Transcript_27198/g.108898 Transcript_27198/m.108898 type:complete len:581 (-) Transcript_27198:1703-3445(-)
MLVLNPKTQRETGRTAQLSNIHCAAAVSDIVTSTLGPRAMLKMLLDPMGGVVITNDANSILREVDVSHPAAKQMIELSRAQDEEVGDGTTSVIVLTGELLRQAAPFLERTNLHPTVLCKGYAVALEAMLAECERIARPVDLADSRSMKNLVHSCLGTKFSSRFGDLVIDMAIEATLRVARDVQAAAAAAATAAAPPPETTTTTTTMDTSAPGGDAPPQPLTSSVVKEVDVKRYAKVEKIPGGEPSESRVLRGVAFNKDVTHPRMRRRVVKPRILLLDCPLEYKRGESNANVQIEKEEDWNKLLRIEEEYIENLCAQIVAAKPDVVITEKGVSDLAQHYLMKANITAFRRLRKTDNNRVARAVGATVVSRPDEIQESDIGTKCGLFEVRKLGDEYFAFLDDCEDPKACTILLRGGSKDVLNEVERNLQDAMQVVKNVVLEPKLLPGGGATEMALHRALTTKATDPAIGVLQFPIMAVARAMEVVPRTLAKNCGAKVVRVLTQLKAKHLDAAEGFGWGVDGTTGQLVDMRAELGTSAQEDFDERTVWDPFAVKVQMLKTAVEAASLILRIDDVVSGISKSKK